MQAGFRPGAGHACRPRDHGALPGGDVPAFEHAVCGGDARGERGIRVRGAAGGSSGMSAWCRRCRCWTTPRARRIVSRGTRPVWPGCPGCSAGIIVWRPGSAIRAAAGRRAVWRTRSGSCAATSWSRSPAWRGIGSRRGGCRPVATISPGVGTAGWAGRSRTLYFVKLTCTVGTAVGILDRIHPMLPGPNPCDTAWGSYNPGRSLS